MYLTLNSTETSPSTANLGEDILLHAQVNRSQFSKKAEPPRCLAFRARVGLFKCMLFCPMGTLPTHPEEIRQEVMLDVMRSY